MTSVSKNVHIDKSDNIVNKCSNKYHDTMKMKPVDVQSSRFYCRKNDKDLKFEVGNHERTSKYKNIFANDYTLNWSQ